MPHASSAVHTTRPRVAAFDFDGTLSEGTSGIRFFRALLGRPAGYWLAARHLIPTAGYFLRVNHERSLAAITREVFRGRSAAEVRATAARFAEEEIPRHLFPAGMTRLREHLRRGDRCVIVSRAYAWCLQPWAEALGVTDVLATRLEVGADGLLTGRLTDASCDGEEKRVRLLRLLGDRARWEIYAYGDGPGDFAMLAEADHAYLRRGDTFIPWLPAAVRTAKTLP